MSARLPLGRSLKVGGKRETKLNQTEPGDLAEMTKRAAAVGQEVAGEHHPNPPRRCFQPRRPRVIPNRLLAHRRSNPPREAQSGLQSEAGSTFQPVSRPLLVVKRTMRKGQRRASLRGPSVLSTVKW